jgi:hypothetical protein
MTSLRNEGFSSLCHPDTEKSCGACCGLYNWRDHSRHRLRALLAARTELYTSCKARTSSIELYRARVRQLDPPHKLCEAVYNCEFLGFTDEGKRRVGCLLHPAANSGSDLRSLSFYGKELCQGHQCPSHSYLSKEEKKAVMNAVDDWYLYGLVITDIDLVKDFLEKAAVTLGSTIQAHRIRGGAPRKALAEFFSLKETWPFRSRGSRFGKYAFSYAEYRIAKIDYARLGLTRASPFDGILSSLGSEFSSARELKEAEEIVGDHLRRFTQTYEGDGN